MIQYKYNPLTEIRVLATALGITELDALDIEEGLINKLIKCPKYSLATKKEAFNRKLRINELQNLAMGQLLEGRK